MWDRSDCANNLGMAPTLILTEVLICIRVAFVLH